jgi:hypothetical protein
MRDSNSARGTSSDPTVATAVERAGAAVLFPAFFGAGAPCAIPSAAHAATPTAKITLRVRLATSVLSLPFPGY